MVLLGSGSATPFLRMVGDMLRNEISTIIHQAAANLGYVIYDSSIYLKGANTKINVKIDGEKVISHGDCELYSNELSRLLDERDILPNYSLEISSPGINREIRNLKDFHRFISMPVKIIYAIDGEHYVIKGILSSVENDSVIIDEDKSIIAIYHRDIIKANLDY